MSELSAQSAPAEVKPDAVRKIAIVGEIPLAGLAVAKAVTAAGLVARVLCPDSAVEAALTAALGQQVEIVMGDLGSAAAVSSALTGVHGACFVSPIGLSGRLYRAETHLDDVRQVIQSAEAQGLRKLVYHSAVGAGAEAQSRALRDAAKAEELISNSRCEDFRVRTGPLMGRNDGFMTEIVRQARAGGPFMTVLGYGGTLVQPIAADDFGRCLAKMFEPAADALNNGVYAVVGPETRSLLELTDSALELLHSHKLKIHAPFFVLKLRAALGGSAKFKERLGLLFDAFAVDQNDVSKLLGDGNKLKAPMEVQRELLAQ